MRVTATLSKEVTDAIQAQNLVNQLVGLLSGVSGLIISANCTERLDTPPPPPPPP